MDTHHTPAGVCNVVHVAWTGPRKQEEGPSSRRTTGRAQVTGPRVKVPTTLRLPIDPADEVRGLGGRVAEEERPTTIWYRTRTWGSGDWIAHSPTIIRLGWWWV